MKPGNIIHLFIAIILLVSTIGVVINKHYSGGELFSTALFVEAESCCSSSCCHSQPVSGCEEESDYYRLIADYIMPGSESNIQEFGDEFNVTGFDVIPVANYTSALVLSNTVWLFANSPPKATNIRVLYHSLLI